jgi:hypothetical protein
MKLHLTLLTFILISINLVFSQNNNLQYNRALFEEFTITVPSNSTNVNIYQNSSFIGNLIVPTGKVWKIETFSSLKKTFYDLSTISVEPGPGYIINNFYLPASSYPVWLPAGSYQIYLNEHLNGVPQQMFYSSTISGIEFNLVP